MKNKILILLILILLISCTKRDTSKFEEICASQGYQWMEMVDEETKEICYGCMVNDNHICTLEEFNDIVENNK